MEHSAGYTLGTTPSGLVAAAGPDSVFRELIRLPGSRSVGDGLSVGSYVIMPPTRLTFLCAESIAAAASVSHGYAELRNATMSPTREEYDFWDSVAPAMPVPLLRHQRDFCAWAVRLRGVFNASEQGTGKTAMSSALIGAWRKMHGYFRVLLVAPKSPMRQWDGELARFLGAGSPLFVPLDAPMSIKERIDVIQGMPFTDGEPIVIAVNYEVLDSLSAHLVKMRPHLVIFDESWKAKNPVAKVTKAGLRVAAVADKVMCLNGSPSTQDVGDLWSQYAFCVGTGIAGRYSDWMLDYAKAVTFNVGHRSITKYNGVRDYAGLMTRLAPVYWRATKSACLDLPEKLDPVVIELPMSPQVQAMYEAVLEDGEQALGQTGPPLPDALDEDGEPLDVGEAPVHENLSLAGAALKVLRLQQITSGFLPRGLMYGTRWEWPEEFEGVRPAVDEERDCYVFDSPKREWLRGWIRDNMSGDTSVRMIVWCKFNFDVHMAASIAAEVLGEHAVARVVGGRHGIKDKDLGDVKDSFNSRSADGVRVISAQIKRLAFGHNLQAGDWNLYYSHSWSYLEQDQSEDRTHRYGRVGPVGYMRAAATFGPRSKKRHTVDHDIMATLAARETMAERLARDTTTGRED